MTQTHARPGAENTGANDESCRGTRFTDQSTQDVPVGYKRCTKCGEVKPYNEFNRNRSKSDGLDWRCRACKAAYYAEKRANAPVARWLRGEVDDTPAGIEAWLLERVDRGSDDTCWTWTGATNSDGYGHASFDGVKVLAHHVALRLWTGVVVPGGLQVDHLCRSRLCSNPAHLEVVTPRENTLRGIGIAAKNAVKTHCDNGHELTDANTYIDANGWRYCRVCRRERNRAHYDRTRNGELTPEQKLNRGIFARTITFDVTERSA